MSDYSRDELLELASLHAIGATTGDERAALEAAMRGDASLVAEFASFRDTASALGTRDSATPTPGVREALLTAVARERSAAPTPTTVLRPTLSSRGAPRLPRWMPAALGTALAASLLLTVGLSVQNRRTAVELRAAEERARVAAAALAAREATLNIMLEAERELLVAHLVSAQGTAGPGIQFFWNARQGRALAHVFRLPPAPQGRAYQIWMLHDGKPVSVAVFNSDADGHAVVERFTLPAAAIGVSDVLVSVEPAGGSPLPTTAPFLAGKFPVS